MNNKTPLVASVLFSCAALSACSVISTTADVAKAGVSIASTVGNTAVGAASATVSAASAAKTVTVATANTAIAGAALVGSGVTAAIMLSRGNEISHAPVTARAADAFVMADGRIAETQGCEQVVSGKPGILVVDRDGKHEVRVNGVGACNVVRLKDAP
jgi:hypothetical protein